jgi:hypothetical protein
MSTGEDQEPVEDAREPTEEELRAAYEGQVKRLRVDHVVLETVVTLANLGMRRTGLAPGTEDERDAEQVRVAIESMRALMPLIEQTAPAQAAPVRDALSQLQLAFVRIGGQPAPPSAVEEGSPGGGGAPSGPAGSTAEPGASGEQAGRQPPQQPDRDEPGPAQRSGRLWVPGQ